MPASSDAAGPAPRALVTTGAGEWRNYGTIRAAYEIGTQPVLSLRCEEGEDGLLFKVVHHAPPEQGAQALLAVIGNRRIARLPVDAQVNAEAGWLGVFDPRDPRLEVFTGGQPLEATLPGGGTTRMPASPVPSTFLASCIAQAPPPEPAVPELVMPSEAASPAL